MVYSYAGSSDLFWYLVARPLTSCGWAFQLCVVGSLWRIDSIFWMFEKTQKCPILVNSLSPLSNKPPPPSNTLEINKPPMARGLNRGFMLWRLNNRHIMLTKVDDFNCAVVILQSNVLSVLFGFLLNLT